MECENCCEAFVGTYEGYYISKEDKTMRVCYCCKNEYVMMGWTAIKVEEDLDEEIRCPTCCSFIVVGQLIAEDERYCENCWEPKEDDELLALSDILKKYVDADTHNEIMQEMKQEIQAMKQDK